MISHAYFVILAVLVFMRRHIRPAQGGHLFHITAQHINSDNAIPGYILAFCGNREKWWISRGMFYVCELVY